MHMAADDVRPHALDGGPERHRIADVDLLVDGDDLDLLRRRSAGRRRAERREPRRLLVRADLGIEIEELEPRATEGSEHRGKGGAIVEPVGVKPAAVEAGVDQADLARGVGERLQPGLAREAGQHDGVERVPHADRHARIGERAHDEFVPGRDDALLERHHQARVEGIVEDAAADDVAIVEEADAPVRLGPGRGDEEGALADLAADDAFALEILQRLHDGDQREVAETHDLVLRLDPIAGLEPARLPAPEQHVAELEMAGRGFEVQTGGSHVFWMARMPPSTNSIWPVI